MMVSLRSLLLLGGVVGSAWGKAGLYGMNIAGFEFGCAINGTCPLDQIVPPLTSLKGGDGAGQMAHFVKDDGMNAFRLPVSWQYLTNNKIGPLSKANFAQYDKLMQSCLAVGAYCVLDVHNFARWNGGIIGQGGPTNAEFADLWTQLATHYADNEFVIFELMNEPHDLIFDDWVVSAQAAVNAIRAAETVSHIILLPGDTFSSAGTFISKGWGAAMANVTNPDKSTTNLIFDLHKYLDIDNSGDHEECLMDNVAPTFEPVAAWLRTNKRQAIVSETGAAASDSCFVDFCAQNAYLNNASDVYIGYMAWGAGSLGTKYLLDLAPSRTGTKWTDMPMAVSCVIDVWATAAAVVTPVWGLSLATANISTMTSSSAAATLTGTATKGSNGGTVGTQTSLAAGTTKTISPGGGSGGGSQNSASGVKVGGGLMMGSLLLALMIS